MKNVSFAALGLLVMLGACATPEPTFGDLIRTSEYGELADDWDRAEDAREKAADKLAEATRKVRRGENLIEEARADIRRGENMIEEGRRDIRRYEPELATAKATLSEIEARYRNVAPGTDAE